MSFGTRIAKSLLLGLALVGLTGASLSQVDSEPAPEGGAGGKVDLELVLAVDTSSSVSRGEFDLQMKGLADAFRHPAVVAAIRATGDLGIAVSLIQWSDNRKQFTAIDWHKIQDEASAAKFSEEIENTPRFLVGGGTALGGALTYAVRQFERNDFSGRRQVIDISGDGRTNQGAHPSQIRDQAVAAGITINGLAILNEDIYVDRYYLRNVIGGTGAFVMSAADYSDFATAILEKLVKEIAGVPVAGLPEPTSPTQLAATPEPEGPVPSFKPLTW